MASNVSGEKYLGRLCRYAAEKEARGELQVAPSVRISFGGLVTCDGAAQLVRLPSTQFSFRSDRSEVYEKPSRGIEAVGPFQRCASTPRLLVVWPSNEAERCSSFLNAFLYGRAGNNGPLRRGFLETYGFSDALLEKLRVSSTYRLAESEKIYSESIRASWDPDSIPNAAILFLPEGTDRNEPRGPYMDAKAWLLVAGVPSQVVRMETVFGQSNNLPFVLENIAVALHAKLGGRPWVISTPQTDVREIVLGMAHAEVGESQYRFSQRRRFMGITTFFTSDGNYIMGVPSERCEYDDYPQALTRSVREILARLREDQGWRSGDKVRLVVHTRKPLRNTDVASIVQKAAEETVSDMDFQAAYLTVFRDHPWKVVDPRSRGIGAQRGSAKAANTFVKGECAPCRGTLVRLSPHERLICVRDAGSVLRPTDPIPTPLRVELHRRSTYGHKERELDALAKQVFDFAGLSWRSMRVGAEPATLRYAYLIADQLNKLAGVKGWSEQCLESHLSRSCWFL